MRDPPIDFRMDSDRWYWRASDGRVINKPAFLSSTFAEMVKLSRIASHIMAAVYDKHLAYRLRLKMAQINKIWYMISHAICNASLTCPATVGPISATGINLYEEN